MTLIFILLFYSLLVAKSHQTIEFSSQEDLEQQAIIFLQQLNDEAGESYNTGTLASWAFNTNITDENQKKMTEVLEANAEKAKNRWNRLQAWSGHWQKFTNESLRRQFMFFSTIGDAALPKQEYAKLTALETEMGKTYETATICDYHNQTNCELSLDPELRNKLRSSRDYDELLHIWIEWRNASGKPSRQNFTESIALKNQAAKINGYDSMADWWLSWYESDSFENDVEVLYKQVQPLYQQLHAYVRRKLRKLYGESKVSKRGPLPAHLLGNMWAQDWASLKDILTPFPEATEINTTSEMLKQNYTIRKMYEQADDFFASLNLSRVPDSFWNLSMLEKPEGRKVACHPSAWDFYDGKDFRIKQCTKIDMDDFVTVHHELGHIQYFMMYKDQPIIFRDGANPGFHEAVGDVISLSVITPEHLHKVGLLDSLPKDDKSDLNFLMDSGLQRIAFLPFGYLVDKWRWDVSRGIVTPENYTCSWWKNRYNIQGMKPPVKRTETDFDPAAKYHISGYTPYIRYFVSYILQFQFHKAACLLAGKYDPNDPTKPLHRCDIYESVEAGNALRDMLKLGDSKHWTVALQAMTGTDKMDASALLEYFKPLHEWLQADNEKNNEFIGWEGEMDNFCLSQPTERQDVDYAALINSNMSIEELEDHARSFMETVNKEAGVSYNTVTKATWKFNTNITDENQKKMIEAKKVYAKEKKDRVKGLQVWNDVWKNFTDVGLKRQFHLFSQLDDAVLPEVDFAKLATLTADMTTTYETGTICDFKNTSNCDLSFDPDLRLILKESQNNEELLHVWKEWRDVSGSPSRQNFTETVSLKNKAAQLNGFDNFADMWLSSYESDTFEADVRDLHHQLHPLYEQLHAYTRRHLRKLYGEEIVSKRGPIPAHLLGNMWAQDWSSLSDILKPYPDVKTQNVKEEMIKKNYTAIRMFEMADDFFASLNLSRVSDSFWNLSMLSKPEGRKVVCHPSAWDFYDGKDFRIKQCTEVTRSDFRVVHHEMGHIQYYMMYKDLPVIFRDGANPGFHEAVGDVLALSFDTPEHLNVIGLIKTLPLDKQSDLNFLMGSALQKIAYSPYAYLVDRWRWDVSRGLITPENYTCSWWKYRYSMQGLKPPVLRTELDFDPAAKWHLSSYFPYIRYFVSNVLQFQFHKAACLTAGKYDPNDPKKPLHRCDIYGSTEAGNSFGDLLRLGRSKHWKIALKAMTGTDKMDASAMLEYFRPLSQWLEKDNQENNEFIGWEKETENFCQPEPQAPPPSA